MSVDELLVYLTNAATVLGFVVLVLVLVVIMWGFVIFLKMVSTWHDNWRYTRRRRRRHDEEWDDVRSEWLRDRLGMKKRTDTVEQNVVSASDRTPTLEFDLTVHDILTYSEENHNHDAA